MSQRSVDFHHQILNILKLVSAWETECLITRLSLLLYHDKVWSYNIFFILNDFNLNTNYKQCRKITTIFLRRYVFSNFWTIFLLHPFKQLFLNKRLKILKPIIAINCIRMFKGFYMRVRIVAEAILC